MLNLKPITRAKAEPVDPKLVALAEQWQRAKAKRDAQRKRQEERRAKNALHFAELSPAKEAYLLRECRATLGQIMATHGSTPLQPESFQKAQKH